MKEYKWLFIASSSDKDLKAARVAHSHTWKSTMSWSRDWIHLVTTASVAASIRRADLDDLREKNHTEPLQESSASKSASKL